jgi:uncharacterized coiled-coil DUF342 family protein
MLDEKDIQKLIEAFPTREEVVSKQEFENFRTEMKNEFSGLHTSIDAYAKKADTYFQEMVMLAHKVDRLEKWISEIAKKIGMKLEF